MKNYLPPLSSHDLTVIIRIFWKAGFSFTGLIVASWIKKSVSGTCLIKWRQSRCKGITQQIKNKVVDSLSLERVKNPFWRLWDSSETTLSTNGSNLDQWSDSTMIQQWSRDEPKKAKITADQNNPKAHFLKKLLGYILWTDDTEVELFGRFHKEHIVPGVQAVSVWCSGASCCNRWEFCRLKGDVLPLVCNLKLICTAGQWSKSYQQVGLWLA